MKLKPKITVNLEEGYSLKITFIECRKHSNGFISVRFGYLADSELKHLFHHYTSVSNSDVCLALKSHDSDTVLEVRLNSGEYRPLYYQNEGYGGTTWFGPKGWENYDKSELIYDE